MLRRLRVPPSAVRWACLLYAIMPAGFLLFLQGPLAQNVGQWFGICYIALLVFAITGNKRLSQWQFFLLTTTSFVASLGHFGVFLNFSLMLVLLLLLSPRVFSRHSKALSTWFAGSMLAVVLYYSAFWQTFLDQIYTLARSAEDARSLRMYWLRRFVWELGIRDHYQAIYLALAVCSLIVLYIKMRDERSSILRSVYGAMLATSALLGFLQVMISFNPTRYVIFSFTAVVILAAFFLQYVDQYRGGRLLTRSLVCYSIFSSLSMWASGFALHQRIGLLG